MFTIPFHDHIWYNMAAAATTTAAAAAAAAQTHT